MISSSTSSRGGRQGVESEPVPQEVVARPGAEMGVGDDEGAHPGRSIRA